MPGVRLSRCREEKDQPAGSLPPHARRSWECRCRPPVAPGSMRARSVLRHRARKPGPSTLLWPKRLGMAASLLHLQSMSYSAHAWLISRCGLSVFTERRPGEIKWAPPQRGQPPHCSPPVEPLLTPAHWPLSLEGQDEEYEVSGGRVLQQSISFPQSKLSFFCSV